MPAIQLGAQTIVYRERGEGHGQPLLIFLHGAGASSLCFGELLNRLCRHHHLIAIDLPGHGRSPGFVEQPAADELLVAYRDIVADFGERVGAGRFFLIGHSMGGAVAQLFALAYPDRLRHLLLIATGARLRVSPQLFEILDQRFEELPHLLAAVGFSPHTDAARAKRWATEQLQAPRTTVADDFRACDGFDIRATVGQIACGVTILSGDDDRLTPPKLQRRLADRIAGSQLRSLSRAGHQLIVERADLVAEIVLEIAS